MKKITAAFTVGDKMTYRGATVNFGAPGKASPLAWIYWTGGFGLLIGVIAYFRFFKKKKQKKKKEISRKKKK